MPQVVKKMWEYIKEHNLQNPNDKRKIILDDKLKTIFKSPLTMFSMNKQLSRHVYVDGAASHTSFKHACPLLCKLNQDITSPWIWGLWLWREEGSTCSAIIAGQSHTMLNQH